MELAERIERGDLRARRLMIEGHLGLVRMVASEYRGFGVPRDDIVQEGTIGLISALDRFDHRRGVRFQSYAGWWIRGAMLRAIADWRLIRLPARAGQQLAAIRRAEAAVESAGQRRATDAWIAGTTGLSLSTVRCLRHPPHVTETPGDSWDMVQLREIPADSRSIDLLEQLTLAEEHRLLLRMLMVLPLRQREILIRRYGLCDQRAQAHHEIATQLGVSEQRIRQLEREALHRIRELAGGKLSASLRSDA